MLLFGSGDLYQDRILQMSNTFSNMYVVVHNAACRVAIVDCTMKGQLQPPLRTW